MRSCAPLVFIVASACGPRPAIDVGRDVFNDPLFSSASTNEVSCAHCHDTDENPGRVRPGYTMFNVAARPTFWGGPITNLLDAVSFCLRELMAERTPLDPEDERGRALFVYLQSLSPAQTATARALTVVRDIVDVPSGDATRGEVIYKETCSVCHGDPHVGNDRLGRASILPDDTIATFGTDKLRGARMVTIEKVRHGKFYGIGGAMPLYSLEAMSNVQLGDVLAYLETFGLPK
jgi:thiosulfate dehydrogenase